MGGGGHERRQRSARMTIFRLASPMCRAGAAVVPDLVARWQIILNIVPRKQRQLPGSRGHEERKRISNVWVLVMHGDASDLTKLAKC
jgi:hypothetical protein